ncbi:MAG: cyclophilin-like family protein [Candidatus Helarchaeota archaeon]
MEIKVDKEIKIRICFPAGDVIVILNHEGNAILAKMFHDSLPTREVPAHIWGQEIFCYLDDIFQDAPLNVAQTRLEVGQIAFYPGRFFYDKFEPNNPILCIFFGPTPISTDAHPVAADDVYVLGEIIENFDILKEVEVFDLIQVLKY